MKITSTLGSRRIYIMKQVRCFTLTLLIFASLFKLNAQSLNIDSLKGVWSNTSLDDSTRLAALHSFTWHGYLFSQPDSALYFSSVQFEFAEKAELKYFMAGALNIEGQVYRLRGDFAKAVNAFDRCLKISEERNDSGAVAVYLSNIAMLQAQQGNLVEAIDYFENALKIARNIGHDRTIGGILINLGICYMQTGNEEKALQMFNENLMLARKTNNQDQIARTYNNFASFYKNKEESDSAIYYYQKSLEIKEKLKELDGVALVLNRIAIEYGNRNNLAKAVEYSVRSLNVAQDIGSLENIKSAAQSLKDFYIKTNKYDKALEMYELYIESRDSLNSEANQKQLIRQQYKYQYEKQAAADSIKSAEEAKVKDAQIAKQEALAEKQDAELENKRNQQYALFGGLALVLVFALFIFNRFRITRKQRDIIEVQKNEVEVQKNAAEHQKELVEEKNKEIMDSINYAKRLQEAILPPSRLVKEWLPQSFILYKPKDIVAGDFYWMESVEGWIYFAAADCTGHGVPGAMVSVVCSNALSKALIEEKKTTPAEILDRTRELVIDRFGRSEEEIKDGMDVALCALNWQTGELQYAGANNPLWIIRKGAEEVEETKADKQPIGKYGEEKPFTNHSIKLEKGDSLYIFSDGYPDQFGGEKGKKYKSGKLKRFLLSIQDKDMRTQRQLMTEEFENWRGEIEQIDDVCVIGVKV